MSSPVARRSPSPSAASTGSGSSTSHSSSGSSSPARGLYVPLHKRSAPSSATSVSAKSDSSSRPCSPSRRRAPGSPTMDAKQTAHPRIYTTGYLLSLRPFATEGLKEKMRASCPEVVMNRRMRKSIEFNEHQARSASKREQQAQQQHSPTLAPSFVRAPADEESHEEAQDIPASHPYPTSTPPAAAAPAAPTPRVTPRRARPAGRAPERRRQALHHDSWHGLRSAGAPMPLVSV